jgi:hypothetical protein
LYGGGFTLIQKKQKTRSKRTNEHVQAKHRNKNNTFQSDTSADRRIPNPILMIIKLTPAGFLKPQGLLAYTILLHPFATNEKM